MLKITIRLDPRYWLAPAIALLLTRVQGWPGAWASPVTLGSAALMVLSAVPGDKSLITTLDPQQPRTQSTKTINIAAASEQFELERTTPQSFPLPPRPNITATGLLPSNTVLSRVKKPKMGAVDRLRALLQKQDGERGGASRGSEYESLVARDNDDDDSSESTIHGGVAADTPFYWLEYMVFLLLGIAMLWAW